MGEHKATYRQIRRRKMMLQVTQFADEHPHLFQYEIADALGINLSTVGDYLKIMRPNRKARKKTKEQKAVKIPKKADAETQWAAAGVNFANGGSYV